MEENLKGNQKKIVELKSIIIEIEMKNSLEQFNTDLIKQKKEWVDLK